MFYKDDIVEHYNTSFAIYDEELAYLVQEKFSYINMIYHVRQNLLFQAKTCRSFFLWFTTG